MDDRTGSVRAGWSHFQQSQSEDKIMTRTDWTTPLAIGMALGLIAGAVGGCYAGRALGEYQTAQKMKGEAISEGLAHYNPVTGDWEWGRLYDSGIVLEESFPKIDAEIKKLGAKIMPKKAKK